MGIHHESTRRWLAVLVKGRITARASRNGLFVLACAGLVVCAAGAAEAQTPKNGSKPGSCTDVPVKVTLNAVAVNGVPSTANGGLYGETNADGVSYTDGAPDGTSAKLSCVTGNLVLNLQNSSRYFTVDFSDRLPTLMDAGAIPQTSPQSGYLIQLRGLGTSLGGAGGVFDTWMLASLSTPGQPIVASSGTIYYCSSLGSFSCGASGTLADKYSDTSLIQVYVAPSCASWTIVPLALTSGTLAGNDVAGLVRATTTKPTRVLASGQYSMPFSMTIVRTDGLPGCTGLP